MTDFNVHLNATDGVSAPAGQAKKALDGLQGTVGENAKQWEALRKQQEKEEAQQRKTIKAQEDQAKALNSVAVGVGALNALMAVSIRGAVEQARTQQQLATALDTVGVKYGDVGEELEALIALQQKKTGKSDEEQREALRLLVIQLGDYEKALAALPAALDTSAATGQSLKESSLQVGKALAGVTPTVESLGLKFDQTATFGERLAELQGRVGGQAEASADPLAKMANAVSDIGDALGTALLPLLTPAVIGLQAMASVVEAIPEPMVAIAGAILGGAGVVVGVALLRREVNKFVGTLKTLAVWQNITTGGLAAIAQVIGGAAAAGTVVYGVGLLVDELEDVTTEGGKATGKVKGLGEALGDDGLAGAANDAQKALDAAGGAATRLGGTSEAAAKILAPFVSEFEALLVATGKAPAQGDAVRSLAESYGLLESIDLGGPREQLATFGREVGDVWEVLSPDLRAGVEASLAGMLDELGVGTEQIRAAGGDTRAALVAALADLPAESEQIVAEVLNGLRTRIEEAGLDAVMRERTEAVVAASEEALIPLTNGWSFAAAGATAAMEAELAKAEKTSPEVVGTVVDSLKAKAAELIPSFKEIGEAIPEALKGGLNKTNELLERSYNDGLLPYVERMMIALNTVAEQLGAPYPFDVGGLPDRLDIPEFARGTFSAPGGLSRINERGGELVQLPAGARVTPAHQLAQMLSRMSAVQGGSSLLDGGRQASGGGLAGAPAAAPSALGGGGRSATFYGPVNVYTDRDESRDVLDLLVRA